MMVVQLCECNKKSLNYTLWMNHVVFELHFNKGVKN